MIGFLSSLAFFSSVVAARIGRRDNPAFPDPSVDPFYDVPANVSQYEPGQIIRKRQIPSAPVGAFSAAYQLLYRTTNEQDQATATVGTVWVPLVPASPPKIFSYQAAEDAASFDCAPSWGWVQNSGSKANNLEKDIQGPALVPWATSQGWYIVNPDQEGPNAAWLVGKMEGQAGLDAIRAVINLDSLSAESTSVTMFGYSGGAHTTVWMAELAAQYAPELQIVGAAFGGTPIDLTAAFETLNGGSDAILAAMAVFGLGNGYAGADAQPDLNATINSLLTPFGVEIERDLRAPGACYASLGSDPPNVTNVNLMFSQNILTVQNAETVLAEQSLLSNVSSLEVPVPKFPRFEYHGEADVTVPYWPEAAYVKQQCSHGANIQFTSFPGLNHGEAYIAGLVGALQFIQQSFAGTTPSVTCGSPASVPLPTINSNVAVEVLGAKLSAQIAAELASYFG